MLLDERIDSRKEQLAYVQVVCLQELLQGLQTHLRIGHSEHLTCQLFRPHLVGLQIFQLVHENRFPRGTFVNLGFQFEVLWGYTR